MSGRRPSLVESARFQAGKPLSPLSPFTTEDWAWIIKHLELAERR